MAAEGVLAASLLASSAVFGIVWVLLVADAAYQIVFARPSFLPLERLIRRRVPASAMDCVVQGASKAMIAVGVVLAYGPIVANGLLTLLSSPSRPMEPLAQMPRVAFFVLTIGWVGGFVLGVACFAIALALALRVKYARVAAQLGRLHPDRSGRTQ